MKKFSDFIVKNKFIILIICLLALIPSIIGMVNTKINYNILVYLPDDIETMKGQKILSDDFNLGSFSISIFDNISAKEALEFENEVKKIDTVNKVVSLYDVLGTEIPIEMLPDNIKEKVSDGNSTLLLITFKDSISDEETLKAIEDIRVLAKDKVKVGGMSAMVLDTKNLSESEMTAYVLIAVACCMVVLMFALDSYVMPIILLLNIGAAILFNMGTNYFLGDISYITKAISSILQLGVTTDFSIFLYHQYEHEKIDARNKEEAMSKAIYKTFNSIIGSSTTTIAGFLALCTMQLTLGKDIGIVMAKGVLFGVLSVITLFPALILIFDKLITKTSHKPILPKFTHLNDFIVKNYKYIFVVFLLLIIPAWWGQKNTEVYYNLDKTLPSTLASSIANTELEEKYNIVSPMILLIPKDLSNNKQEEITTKLKNMDHIDLVLSYSELSDLNIPEEMIDEDIKSIFENDKYSLMLINSSYQKATTELNNQIDDINSLVKAYDKDIIVAGEGALTKDLVQISNTDFNNVSYSSIIVIFIIIIFVLKSYSLPVILIVAIETAIFINMGIPYYTGVTIPFVSSIVIGTIQLGATIDYAILMTNKYLEKRKTGVDKKESVKHALNSSVSSIFVSGMCFFAATFGVGLYSDLEMVGSLCSLIARGAIISMIMVVFVLPTLLIIFDKLIIKSTKGFKKGNNNMKKEIKLAIVLLMIILMPINTYALSKDETVYVKTDNKGVINKTIVSEHLSNIDKKEIEDLSYLSDIINTSGDEEYTKEGNNLLWNNKSTDIYYKGLTTKEIPVSLKITYMLDNKEYDNLTSIDNKKGHVTIKIKYTNNEKHGSVYTPFTAILGTSLDNETNTNIKVKNGEIVDNGKNTTIVAIAMPGLSYSLNMSELDSLNEVVIEYDTTSFSTTEMYSIITPKFIDTEEITSSISELYTKMELLNESSTTIVNGSKELDNSLTELNQKYNEFNSSLKALASGSNSLANSYSKELNASINKLKSGINSLYDSIDSNNTNGITYNMNQLSTSIVTLKDALYSLDETVNSIINGINSNSSSLNSAVQDMYNNAILNPDLTEEDLARLSQEKTAIENSNTSVLTYLNGIKNALEKEDGLLNAITVYSNGINSLNSNIQASSSNQYTLSNVITSINSGINGLSSGSEKYNSSISGFNNNMKKIDAASVQIETGITQINNGSTDLYNGIYKFDNEGIKELYKLVNNELKNKINKLNKLSDLSSSYTSFGGASTNTSSKTKFIIQINK